LSINRVNISGNLTRDPEFRSTQGGTNVLSFGLAVNDRRRNQGTGEWEDYANFVDCVLFGSRVEFFSRHLRKGKKVYVEGKLHYSSWERDGQRRSKLEVVVDDIDIEFPPKSQQPQGYQQAPQQGYQPSQGYQYAQPAPQAYQQPQGYQQTPQGYGQPASAPQARQPADYAQPTQYAPQPAPQPQSAPPQQPAQQQMQMPAPQPQQQQFPPVVDVYDEDIPF